MGFELKWMVLSLFVSAIVLLVGLSIYERRSRMNAILKYPPPGELVDVGNRKLHLYCMGDGEIGDGDVTVILEDGLGPMGSLAWVKVQPRVAEFARVCAYDRAGILWSDPSPHKPTGDRIAQDLNQALKQAGIEPPYLFVGLSMGGIYSRIFVERYPEEVAGMVFVDSAHPEQEERFPRAPANLEPSTVQLWLTRQWAQIGVLRLLNHLPHRNAKRIPPEILAPLKAFYPQSIPAVQAETQFFRANLHRAQSPQSLGDRPLVVLTAAKPATLEQYPRGTTEAYLQEERAIWQELQAELATLSSNSQQVIASNSTHLMYFDVPELIIEGIRDAIEEIRRKQPPSPSKETRLN